MWFYAQGTNRQGPVPESEIKSLLASGRLAVSDLAWTEGMTNWAPISALPDLCPAAPAAVLADIPSPSAAPADAVVPVVARHVETASHSVPESLAGWLGFIGVLNIVWGVISCITCIGVITGVFLILSGVALTSARTALQGVQSISPDLVPFFDKLKTYATMTGVLYIVGLVDGLLMIVFCIVILAGFATAAGGF